ncbi:MAG: cupin domain-containing protein [Halanaerobiales bacterium]
MEVKVENPSGKKLEDLGVDEWPIWQKEISEFDWYYDEQEICYIIEGKAKVETPEGTVSFEKGDLVTFPEGLNCKWKIIEDVKKHYTLG